MNDFEGKFAQILEPVLRSIGGTKRKLPTGWIQPYYMYQLDGGLWFQCSYDWRDRYFSADIGKAYLFKDVLPRIIIKGNYDDLLSAGTKEGIVKASPMRKKDDLNLKLELIAQTLPLIIKNYDLLFSLASVELEKELDRIRPYIIREIEADELLCII